jgi:hypothetical protein
VGGQHCHIPAVAARRGQSGKTRKWERLVALLPADYCYFPHRFYDGTSMTAHETTARPVQADGLEVNEVEDGLVLYQAGPKLVHYLNNTAAFVFELCSGERTVDEIAAFVARSFDMEGLPIAAVVSCVDELREKGVLR